jgi:hypothetical protein
MFAFSGPMRCPGRALGNLAESTLGTNIPQISRALSRGFSSHKPRSPPSAQL